jgi:hypothetical protein
LLGPKAPRPPKIGEKPPDAEQRQVRERERERERERG